MKIAIIPARGGSKRIPRKNIKDFLGKPIIAYSIEAALKSGLFEEVMVSTDDEEIAAIAREYGAKVPFMRSKKNATDYSTTMDVLDEVLTYYNNQGINYTYTCCIYPTAPFVSAEKLKKAFSVLTESNYDCVFPVISFSFPIQRSLKLDDQQKLSFFFLEEEYLKRSQDFEKAYHDAGQFYFFETEKVLKKGKILTDHSGAIIITEMEGQDIDSEIDWKLAELKYDLITK